MPDKHYSRTKGRNSHGYHIFLKSWHQTVAQKVAQNWLISIPKQFPVIQKVAIKAQKPNFRAPTAVKSSLISAILPSLATLDTAVQYSYSYIVTYVAEG